MKFNATVAVVCLLMATACASPGKRHSDNQIEAPQPAPSPSAPYAGVWLADVDEAGAVSNGAMVLGVVAGPAAIAGVKPNDRIVRINGIAVDADSATAIIKSSSPGDQLVLEVVRGKDVLTITMVIDSVEPWIAPAVLPSAIPFTSSERPEQMGVQDRVMAEVVAAVPDAERLLLGINKMFLSLAREDIGYNKLPLIRAAMLNAAVISQWQHQLADDLRPFELQRDALIEVMCDTLAAACGNREQAAPGQSVTLQTFAEAIAEANQQVRALFEDAGIDRAQAFADLQYLLRTTAAERTLIDQPDVARGLRAMRTSTKINHAVLLDVMAHVLSNASGSVEFSGASRPAPPELSDIVEGEIADYIKIDSGYIVAGGAGSNRYNMSRIYAVIDAGGNDFYQWNDEISLETQTIIDFGGDDRYRASTGGPGAGWLGVSLLIDFAGDDAYESKLGGCGTGALGFGFLFDGDGSDRYHCAAWSIGSSIYGGGAVVDQGMQTDEYISEVFSQGVGGPRGVGILIDAGG
ncbi:MAG: PDZ domain-containing protein, partial [Burkholderiales bacterium]|nr:PDZ domain-containing protein [Burkholderiales bacterium]